MLTMNHPDIIKPTSYLRQRLVDTVPLIGTKIVLNLDQVQFEDEEGKPRTPMMKARFDHRNKFWRQVGLNAAGLLLFFLEEPQDHHTQVEIVRLIPSARAGYVISL